ncbi:MAG TPA: class I SAM-dependent methyltransferase [Verrucomicrobiota bacterium]|nr:class I SAM-dependent methyltransferase [Verrucomicrobiota bacterium]
MSDNKSSSEIEGSLVIFQSTQSGEIRGSLLKLTSHLAIVEVYNPSIVLRSSEVLPDLKIVVQSRVIYSGRAVVSNLVTTGSVAMCELKLDESKFDTASHLTSGGDAQISKGFSDFLDHWQKVYRVLPEFKVIIADMQTFLTDLRLWLEQVELGLQSASAGDRVKIEQDIADSLRDGSVGAVNHLFERFEDVARKIDPELVPAHQAFGKRLVLPLLLASPFVYRTYQKPLGYAGDYEMVNMMFRNPAEGGSLFAKIVNVYALQLPPILGHRNRIELLEQRLVQEARRVALNGRSLRVFNLGCGPAHEIQRFLASDPVSSEVHFTLCDFNDETLAHTGGILNDLKNRHGRRTVIQMQKKSVHQMLKQADRVVQLPPNEAYDVVVCAGLFDYLSDKVCRKLIQIFYSMLGPGGLLITTNVDVHPARNEMEYFLEWHLIHRNTEQMRSLAPQRAAGEDVLISRDATGVNVFMDVRKPNV